MDTKDALRESAGLMIRRGGFNAMSFADLAQQVGIRTASVHYHYPTKRDLGVDVMLRYHEAFFETLDRQTSRVEAAPRRLKAYGALFERALLEGGGLCLGGMFATELPGLDPALKAPVERFFTANVEWISRELLRGKDRGELTLPRPARQIAASLFSAVQGAMIVARTLENPKHIREATAFFLAALRP
ncbi:MAG: TetR family transcriptional regulator [Myxococcota bacterium]